MKDLSNKPYAVFIGKGKNDLTFFMYRKASNNNGRNSFYCTHGDWEGYYKTSVDGMPSLYGNSECREKDRIASYTDLQFLTESEYEKAYTNWEVDACEILKDILNE